MKALNSSFFCIFLLLLSGCAKDKKAAQEVTPQSDIKCDVQGFSYGLSTELNDVFISDDLIILAGFRCLKGKKTWLLSTTYDSGVTFDDQILPPPSGEVKSVLREDSGKIFAIGTSDNTWLIHEFGGRTRTIPLEDFNIRGAITHKNVTYIYGSQMTEGKFNAKIFKSPNGGESWTEEFSTQSISEVSRLKVSAEGELLAILNNRKASNSSEIYVKMDTEWKLLHKVSLKGESKIFINDLSLDNSGRIWLVGTKDALISASAFRAAFIREVSSDGLTFNDVESYAYSLSPPKTKGLAIHADREGNIMYLAQGYSNRQRRLSGELRTEKLNWLIRSRSPAENFKISQNYQYEFGNYSFPKSFYLDDSGSVYAYGSEHIPSQSGKFLFFGTRAIIRVKKGNDWETLLTHR